MPKVNTEISVSSNRCGFSSVPGQNSLDDIGPRRLQLLEQLAVAAVDPRRRRQHPLLERACRRTRAGRARTPRRGARPRCRARARLPRENSDIFSDSSGRSIARRVPTDPIRTTGTSRCAREDRVELRDATRPRIQVVPGDTVDQYRPLGLELGSGSASAQPYRRAQVVILLQLGGLQLPRHGLDQVGGPPPRLVERAPHVFARRSRARAAAARPARRSANSEKRECRRRAGGRSATDDEPAARAPRPSASTPRTCRCGSENRRTTSPNRRRA